MANKKIAPVHPNTLRWAREDLGLSLEQAAEKTKFSPQEIIDWENGVCGMTLTQAKKFAEKYKVSLPFIYLKKTPDKHKIKDIVDFRSYDGRQDFSDRLHLAIKKSHARQLWMRQILIDEGKTKLDWLGSFSQNSNVQHIAKACKKWLGISQDEISCLPDDKEALNYWVTKIEAKGVSVANNHTHNAYKVDRKEYSGLVLYDEYAPLILLNPKDSPARRIFTLLHELAHLLVKPESSLSLIDFRADEDEYDAVEVRCNAIASNILIEDTVIKQGWHNQLSIKDNITALTIQLKVSYSAIAVAVKKHNLIDELQLGKLLDFYKQQYQQNVDIPTSGRTIPDKQVLDFCGKLLTTKVLDAYERGTIDALEVNDVLGMKLKYLNDLSERINFPLHRWIS